MDAKPEYNNEDPESHVNDEPKNYLAEDIDVNKPAHVTLRKKENENNGAGSLSSNQEPDALESVQKYTNRIKSFLGWESNEDGEELKKEQNSSLDNPNIEISPAGVIVADYNELDKNSSTEDFKLAKDLNKASDVKKGFPVLEYNTGECSELSRNSSTLGGDIDFQQNESAGNISNCEKEILKDNDRNNLTSTNSGDKESKKQQQNELENSLENLDSSINAGSNVCDKSGIENKCFAENDTVEECIVLADHTSENIPQPNKSSKVLAEKDNVKIDSSLQDGDSVRGKVNESLIDSTLSKGRIELNVNVNLCGISTNISVDKITDTEKNGNLLENNDTNSTECETSVQTAHEKNKVCLDISLSEKLPEKDLDNTDSSDNQQVIVLSSEITMPEFNDNKILTAEPSAATIIDNTDFETPDLQPIHVMSNGIIEECSEVHNIDETVNMEKENESQFDISDISSSNEKSELASENQNNTSDSERTVLSIGETYTNNQDDYLLTNKIISKPYLENVRRLSLDIVKDVIESARSSIHEKFLNKTDEDDLQNDFQLRRTDKNEPLNENYEYKIDENCKEVMIDEETICGFGCFKPKWLQKYATVKVFLFLFSLIGVVHGAYYNYFVAMISTLEKRYAFKSKISGTFLLADEITPLFLGILVGYIGDKTHRPRMVALGMFLSATCCFVTAMPYFIFGSKNNFSIKNTANGTSIGFCDNKVNNSLCQFDDQQPKMSVAGLFYFASFLKGFATLSYYVIGIPYMDDNAKKKNSPLYLAIALALRLLGPLVGFLMSSGFLKLYENPFEDPGFGPDDPRWIGAWWMGFCLQGALLIIFTIPIALFPKRLPGQRKPKQDTLTAQETHFKDMFTGLLGAIKRLIKNPIFICLAIETTMKIFGHFGHAIMLPKYMENQFRLSASDASLFSGATSIACIMVSTVLGGFLIWKFRPRPKLLLAGMITSETMLCLGYLILMIPRCQSPQMKHFGNDNDGLVLNSSCNQGCDCTSTSFTPFCAQDGKTVFFSPCFAGCTLELDDTKNNLKVFGNCSCAVDEEGDMGGKITEGFCVDENCWTQTVAYIFILLLLVSISNIFTVAHTMLMLRCVNPNDKSVALGTFEAFICLFGFIPFPVTFGALVDSACLVWEKSCDQTGNCWFYNIEKYNYLLHGVSSLFCCFSIFCLITLYFLSPRLRNLYKDDDEEGEIEASHIKLDIVSSKL